MTASGYAQTEAYSDAVAFIKVTRDGSPTAYGSGVLINSSGFILTARHVLDTAVPGVGSIMVSFKSKNAPGVPATIFDCGLESVLDFCIIRVNDADVRDIGNIPSLDCGKIDVETKLYARGYPEGNTNGQFIVPGQTIGTVGEGFAQPTNLSIAPGMSGGPVFNGMDAVVGILIAVADQTSHAYFIPLSEVQQRLLATNAQCSVISGTSPPSQRVRVIDNVGPVILRAGETRAVKFDLDEAGFVDVTISNITANWTGLERQRRKWMAAGKGNTPEVWFSICSALDNKCGGEGVQKGINGTSRKQIAAGPGSVVFFNFRDSPPISISATVTH